MSVRYLLSWKHLWESHTQGKKGNRALSLTWTAAVKGEIQCEWLPCCWRAVWKLLGKESMRKFDITLTKWQLTLTEWSTETSLQVHFQISYSVKVSRWFTIQPVWHPDFQPSVTSDSRAVDWFTARIRCFYDEQVDVVSMTLWKWRLYITSPDVWDDCKEEGGKKA